MSVEIPFLPISEPSPIDFAKNIVTELQNWGFIGEVIELDPTVVRTAYTWITSKYQRDTVLEWYKQNDIISTGRYGKWKFQGMVQSIEDGLAINL